MSELSQCKTSQWAPELFGYLDWLVHGMMLNGNGDRSPCRFEDDQCCAHQLYVLCLTHNCPTQTDELKMRNCSEGLPLAWVAVAQLLFLRYASFEQMLSLP